jgi:hypothetical protein
VGADDLIDRNRRLLALAEVTCALTRLLVKEVAENRSLLQATLLRTVHLHYGRTGLLADAIYLRFSIAHEKNHSPRHALHTNAARSVIVEQSLGHAQTEGASDGKANGDHPADQQMRPKQWQHDPKGHEADTGIRDKVGNSPATVVSRGVSAPRFAQQWPTLRSIQRHA